MAHHQRAFWPLTIYTELTTGPNTHLIFSTNLDLTRPSLNQWRRWDTSERAMPERKRCGCIVHYLHRSVFLKFFYSISLDLVGVSVSQVNFFFWNGAWKLQSDACGFSFINLFSKVHSTYYSSWINQSGYMNKPTKNQRQKTRSDQENIILLSRRQPNWLNKCLVLPSSNGCT
jgi:hypothetical protein